MEMNKTTKPIIKEFDLNRFNLTMLYKLGGEQLKLNKTKYPKPRIKGGYLVDENGNRIGTKGDMYTKKIMYDILEEGCIDHNPRPRYEDFYEGATYKEIEVEDEYGNNEKVRQVILNDGQIKDLVPEQEVEIKDNGVMIKTPAHTLSVNKDIVCTYDLSKGESPMSTLRPIACKTSIAEIIWIYLLESNDLVEFDKLLGICTWEEDGKIHNWWDEWALRDENGNYILNEKGHPTIGACYGETIRRRHMFKNELIDQIKKDPDCRRLIVSTWQIDDFKDPHGLKPCAFQTIWNVRHGWDGKDYLDMTLIQRSSDFATAGCINQVQYAALQMMVAKELGYTPGYFTWKPINVQLYDRHIEQAIEMLNREPVSDVDATIKINNDVTSIYEITPSDVKILDADARQKIKSKNPQLKFPLGI